MDHMYDQVRQMIEEELDYTKEAESMQHIEKNIKSATELRVLIPKVYPKYCSSKVLVSSYCEGTKIGDLAQMSSWNLDLEDLTKRLIELYCKMILVDGFYHADPHPGNILVNEFGDIILLDFGAVAYLNPSMKSAIPELIESIIRNDTEDTVAALRTMGFLGTEKASRKYVEKIVDLFKEFIHNEVEFDGMNFQNIKLNSGVSAIATLIKQIDLRDVSNNIRIPKDYILLNRTIVLLFGNCFALAPELNTLNVIRPYIQKHILGKNSGLSQVIIDTIKNQITSAISIPKDLTKFLKLANKGELEVEIKGLEKGLERLYYLGLSFLYAILAFIAAYALMEYNQVEKLWRFINWAALLCFVGLFSKTIWRK